MYPQLLVADVNVCTEGAVHIVPVVSVLSLLPVVLSHEPKEHLVFSYVDWFDLVGVKVGEAAHMILHGMSVARFFQVFQSRHGRHSVHLKSCHHASAVPVHVLFVNGLALFKTTPHTVEVVKRLVGHGRNTLPCAVTHDSHLDLNMTSAQTRSRPQHLVVRSCLQIWYLQLLETILGEVVQPDDVAAFLDVATKGKMSSRAIICKQRTDHLISFRCAITSLVSILSYWVCFISNPKCPRIFWPSRDRPWYFALKVCKNMCFLDWGLTLEVANTSQP